MNLFARALPLEGAGRTLALATLINTTGNGMFYAVSAIYFTQVVGLPAVQVGLGLTVAAAVGLGVGVPMGHLADVRGPREMLVLFTILLGVASLGYLVVSGFAGFVAVAVVVTLLDRSSGAARGALTATVGEPGDRVRLRAYLRAVTNVGITVGGLVGSLTLAIDTPAVYRGAVALDAVTYVGAALVARRLPHVPPSPHTGGGPRLVALRDKPFLVVTALNAVMALHYGLVDVALPLWVVERTHAPKWVIGLLLLANTVTVVLLQVRVSRTVGTVGQGATATWRAGLVLALACVVYAMSAHGGPLVAALVLVAGALAQVAGELLQAAGSWAIGFGLAPQEAQGQYQGLFSTGFAASSMLAPAVLTALVVGGGAPGWLVLGAVFTVAGLAVVPATRWALGTAPSGSLVRSAVAEPQNA
ncbi:MAG: MFS transporter [Motilibacteraceae bacterium]